MRQMIADLLARTKRISGRYSETCMVVAFDDRGKPIRLKETSIRAVLTRADALACAKLDADHVRVSAWEVCRTLNGEHDSIHDAIPNRASGAPKSDRAALRALYDHALDRAAIGSMATIVLTVPENVAGWIGLRAARVQREYEAAYG